jgi:hypothetical protein
MRMLPRCRYPLPGQSARLLELGGQGVAVGCGVAVGGGNGTGVAVGEGGVVAVGSAAGVAVDA